MFEQLVESTARKRKDKRLRYFLMTAVVWVMGLSGIVIGGVLAYDARLDEQFDVICHLITPAPPIRLGSDAQSRPRGPVSPAQSPWTDPPRTSPIGITTPPNTPPVTFDASPGDGPGRSGGPPGIGDPHGVPYGVQPAAHVDPAPAPRPTPKPRTEETVIPTRPVRVSSGPLQGQAIRRVEPPYPPLAKLARIEGAVNVEVVIDEAGNVISARALSGHSLLKEAAENAARAWKWRPTLLNGSPVQVVGSITFNFTLR